MISYIRGSVTDYIRKLNKKYKFIHKNDLTEKFIIFALSKYTTTNYQYFYKEY